MKKKKFLATTLMASILTIGSLVPVSASSVTNPGNSTNGNTEVKIEIVDDLSQIGQVSVTVPTVLAIAIYSDKQNTPDGAPVPYVSDVDNNTITEGSGNISFVNRSTTFVNGIKETIPVYLRGVTTNSNGDWSLVKANKPTDTEVKKLQISLGTERLADTAAGGSSQTDFTAPIELQKSTISGVNVQEVKTVVPVTVEVGGKNKDYDKAASSTAFTLQWHIAKTQN